MGKQRGKTADHGAGRGLHDPASCATHARRTQALACESSAQRGCAALFYISQEEGVALSRLCVTLTYLLYFTNGLARWPVSPSKAYS